MWYMKQQRIAFVVVAMLVVATLSFGQQNTQSNTQSSQQGNQQPAAKPSFWDKIKAASNAAQNVQQQGTQQVQQGVQQVQQSTQSATGALQGVTGGAGGNGSSDSANFSAANGGNGSCGSGCFNAGPFGAAVSQMILSQEGNNHVIRMNIQMRNLGNQPVVLAYRAGSNVIVDSLGNAYYSNGSNAVTGMGTDWGGNIDPQFVLAPGQSSNITMQLFRVKVPAAPVAATFNYDVAMDAIDPNDHTKVLRQYSLDFPGLAPGSNNSAATALGSDGPANSYLNNGGGTQSYGTMAVPAAGSSQAGAPTYNNGTAAPAAKANAQTQVPVRTSPTAATAVKTAGLKTTSPVPAAAAPAPTAAKPTPAKPTPAKPAAKTPPPATKTTTGTGK